MTEPMPAAIPWYKSTVLRGVLTIVVTQIVNYLQGHFHIDAQVLGLSVNDVVGWMMDVISAGALAYMTHGRITQKAAPAITATQSKADQVIADKLSVSGDPNAYSPPVDSGSQPPV